MHYELTRFIEAFEREAVQNGKLRSKLGRMELLFLEQVWGPAFSYRYEGLTAEFPFRDYKGGQRFADFVYTRNGTRLLIEVDGFTTHARDINHGEFNDHLSRQNDLILSGWLLLRFSAWQVEHQPERCSQTLMQAIGYWWSRTYGPQSGDNLQLWEIKKQLITQFAIRREGKIRPDDVTRLFQVSRRTASNWLRKLLEEGVLTCPSPEAKRITYYHLNNFVE
ncbi:hypothetical protein [Paenibacillus radicis (ex Gao et al. 2016)]|uniref:DUF559 domain-containing protein n=1 Tax=Paenibacillus radicis (ex Gao et al. 2016) TaxID=1737354 RepID=A0A917HEA0_9BACL|nr:hypothetical protein [Paenibacillus radicis (ex Gao et al. 2016)]GGG77062.1 hypothetical protein GCM10010918_37080 [Paenibacillus radicis (ex Gao et al. 2016)]